MKLTWEFYLRYSLINLMLMILLFCTIWLLGIYMSDPLSYDSQRVMAELSAGSSKLQP